MGLVYLEDTMNTEFYCGGCSSFKLRNPEHPHRCKDCAKGLVRKKPKRHRGKRRGPPSYTRHGLTPQDFATMIRRQKESCAICSDKTRLEVDHNHKCCKGWHGCINCVRGLVCPPCNSYIYMVESGKKDRQWIGPKKFDRIQEYLNDSRQLRTNSTFHTGER